MPSPPHPPLPPYEVHRPLFHLTPEIGHNNDPNGMFYDAMHGMYHVFVQYKEQVVGGTGPE
jgi:sucrose-6-phosphate hydrolase SacC (GH32 family)